MGVDSVVNSKHRRPTSHPQQIGGAILMVPLLTGGSRRSASRVGGGLSSWQLLREEPTDRGASSIS